MRTWLIGSGTDCDLVVAQPTVSGRHCRLTEISDGYLLEDLGSSNGTYVNGARIASATRVSAGDAITLGLTVLMPWPVVAGAPGVTVIRIGRDADNDIVLDDPRVSGRHARLLVVPGSKTLIEDVGSSNGTFLNSPNQRATQAIPLTELDLVYFGSLAIPASRLLTARTEPAKAVPPPPPSPEPEPVPELVSRLPRTTPKAGDLWTVLLLAQGPVIAILIVLISGRPAAAAITATSWESVSQGIASTTFALALSAVWVGGSLAAWESAKRRSSGSRQGRADAGLLPSFDSSLGVVVALCVVECGVLLAIVHWGSGLVGDWLRMFGVLVLASAAGLSLGLVVSSLVRAPAAAVAVLVLSFLPMIALGGWIKPLPAMSQAIRPVAAVMPSRWAFEGLLLLESDRRLPPPDLAGSEPDQAQDLAESFFPAASERMGAMADALALGCMLIGLAAAAVFISGGSRDGPGAP